MKITGVTAFSTTPAGISSTYVFVKVATDEGIVGWGESSIGAASVAAVVSKRRWEIAVRIALGASRPAVLRVVVGRATVLTLVGLLLGLGVGLFSARLLDSLLYGVSPLDPVMHLLTAVTLLGVAVTAASVPVIRGLRLDPAEALKAD